MTDELKEAGDAVMLWSVNVEVTSEDGRKRTFSLPASESVVVSYNNMEHSFTLRVVSDRDADPWMIDTNGVEDR